MHSRTNALPTQIIAAGPEWGIDKNRTATLIWQVWAADADRNPVSRVYKCYSYWKSRFLASSMADERKVPLTEETKDAEIQDTARAERQAFLLGLTATRKENGI